MNTTNEHELREQITPLVIEAIKNDLFDWYYGDEIGDDTWHFMHSVITAHTNAEIARTLDRLEIEMPSKRNTLVGDAYQRTFCNEYNKALKEVSKVIEAERAKLKEVK